MAQVLGIVDIIWRGTRVDVEKGATLMLGGLQQKEVVTNTRVDYAREFMPSKITATAIVLRGMSVLDLFAPGQAELQVQADSGQTWVFPDAFISNRPDITSGEGGKLKIEWAAGAALEQLNG